MEKAIRQFAILYRNARNLLKSNLEVGGTTRWRIGNNAGKLGFDRDEKYYNHECMNQCMNLLNNKLLSDFKIQTDNKIEHNKPDIVVVDKTERYFLIIDVACPFDIRVKDKEKEEIENYQDLTRELKRIWKLRRIIVVPFIIGALGTVSKDIEKWLAEIGVTCRLDSLQRACLLGTARILRKVLDT